MKKIVFLFILYLTSPYLCWSQNKYPDRLKVFIDCQSGCDMTFIRSEINIVDFLLDRVAADVHVLITDQNTGGGGDQYQLIFFGQHQFRDIKDTIRFINQPNNTDFEERDLLLKYLKLGLAPYIVRTKAAESVDIKMKTDNAPDTATNNTLSTKDPWNYWVFTVETYGSLNMDAVYNESSFNGNLTARRITDKSKFGIELNGGKNKSEFEYEDDNGNTQKFVNRNNNFTFSQYLVKSLNDHWSWGYQLEASRNTFSNNKFRTLLQTGIEYNIFPYKEVNTKSLTISYLLDGRQNNYIDSTLYDKTRETLMGHAVRAKLSLNQKWGTIRVGTEYHNYFHNWKYLNLEANIELEIRITGGLSFSIYSSGSLIRDQLFLPKEGATAQEVLTRRRQLASGYSFFTYFGISYRFGSKLNNFVNPRFD